MCLSLQGDLVNVQAYARWRFCWRGICLYESDEVDEPVRCSHISTLFYCKEEDTNPIPYEVWMKLWKLCGRFLNNAENLLILKCS